MTESSDKQRHRLTKVQARKLGGIIVHGAVSFAGSAYITRHELKRKGLILHVRGVGYRATAAGEEAYAAYRWHATRRENPEARKAFDKRHRSRGIHKSDIREVWAWYLAGWHGAAR